MKSGARVILLVSAGVAMLGAFVAYHELPLLPFRPVVSDAGPNHVLTESTLGKDQKSAIIGVLARYEERYCDYGDSIWITPKLYFDKELRWNYTSKSQK